MSVIKAGISDLETIYYIEQMCFTDGTGFSKETIRRQLKSPSFQYFLMLEYGKIHGFVALYVKSGSKTSRIYNLAVRPDSRGKGYAKILLNNAEITSRLMGNKKMVLEVREGNQNAIILYAKNGYRQTKVMNDYYGSGIHAIKHEKDISK